MALLPQPANTETNNSALDDRSAIPAGEYLAHIVKSEMKQTKAGTGHYLSLHSKVLEGADNTTGRMVFTNLNLDNPNPVAVEIATKELNSIAQACQLEGVEDSEELHEIPMVIKVTIKPATGQWPEGNEIGGYKAESEWSGDVTAPAAEVKEEAATPPWEK